MSGLFLLSSFSLGLGGIGWFTGGWGRLFQKSFGGSLTLVSINKDQVITLLQTNKIQFKIVIQLPIGTRTHAVTSSPIGFDTRQEYSPASSSSTVPIAILTTPVSGLCDILYLN